MAAAELFLATLLAGTPAPPAVGRLALVPVPGVVELQPAAGRPGSTLQLFTEAPATVQLGGVRYPSYALGDGTWRTLVPFSALVVPGRYPLTVETAGEQQVLSLTLLPRSFRTQHIHLSPEHADLEEPPTVRAAIGSALASESDVQYWRLPFRRPVAGRLSTGYGLRRTYNGVPARSYYHRGYDLAAGTGTTVIAPAAGRVVLVGTTQRGFRVHGNIVILDHGQGVTSAYLHLSRILVRQGAMVRAGQPIARVGSTGQASGPHLHWGVYVHGVAVDPAEWLSTTHFRAYR